MKKSLLLTLEAYKKQSKSIQKNSNQLKKYGLASTAALAAMTTMPVDLCAQVVGGNLGAPTRVAGSCVGGAGNLGGSYCAMFDFDHDGTYELQIRYYNYTSVYPAANASIDPINTPLAIVQKAGGSFPATPVVQTGSFQVESTDIVYVVPLSGGNGFGFITLDADFNDPVTFHPVTGQFAVSRTASPTVWGGQTDIVLSDIVIQNADVNEVIFPTILPIELRSFLGEATIEGVELTWITDSELNNSGFEIERSVNGTDFQVVSFLPGAGTTNDEQTYSFTDETAEQGTNYFYRLKQIDFDGTFDNSPIVTVTTSGSAVSVNVFPTLVKDNITVQVLSNEAEDGTIEVFDFTGKLMYDEAIAVANTESTFSIDLSGLSSGTYFVKTAISDENDYQKIVVE